MAFATTRTVALRGATGHLIDVQVDVSPGKVMAVLVGRADHALREGLDRVRMAIINSRMDWPATQRITILLSPADLPKSGTHFDLAIATALLAASGKVRPDALERAAFIGELTLSGGLRPAVGVLPMVLAAAERGVDRVFVPEPQAGEAMMVPGMSVFGVRSLAQVIAELTGEEVPSSPPVALSSGASLLSWRGDERLDELDLADLHGMLDVKYAVEVAAAGGHPILLSGPKGAGKTSIAERLPTVLPDLTPEESLELTAVHSLAGVLDAGRGMITRPPYAAPHHDASKASLIGGGVGQVRPGEISRAHCGVLFLDEFPLFSNDVVQALRQPLESGDITVARREEAVTLPARTLLVLACNPCPCGEWSVDPRENRCQCTSPMRQAYRSKIEGPIADRLDITRHVVPPRGSERDPFREPEPSARVAERVAIARDLQLARFGDRSWRRNAQIPSARLKDDFAIAPPARALVEREVFEGRLSARGAVRVQRLAWTVADLRTARTGEVARPGVGEAEVALRLRIGEALEMGGLAAPMRVAG